MTGETWTTRYGVLCLWMLCAHFDDQQIVDLTLLCGWYHAISFTARAARVPLEPDAPTFASVTAR